MVKDFISSNIYVSTNNLANLQTFSLQDLLYAIACNRLSETVAFAEHSD